MEYTTNLNLKKPDINEYYNVVEQENENADIIDEAIGKLNSDVGTEVLTTEAQDCKGAINELNKNSKWKFLETVTGSTTINLPENYEELQIELDYGSGSLCYVFNVNKSMLGDYRKKFFQGYCLSQSSYSYASISVTADTVVLNAINSVTDDITEYTKTSVYYR